MIDKIKNHINELKTISIQSVEELEKFRLKFLGKKGLLIIFFSELRKIPQEQKKEYGKTLNEFKLAIKEKYDKSKISLSKNDKKNMFQDDLSKPGQPINVGAHHPISIVRDKVIDIFKMIGFELSYGPDIEDDWHNFSALNLPEDHPAREMQDTFFIETNPDIVLRTHTSSVQVRHMQSNEPPIRILSPGRVFRNEAVSARSHCVFHQIEGLYINKNVSFADLKQTLTYFTKSMFGTARIRLRPSYFPFTEPSAEVDVYWGLNSDTDYRITKGTGWLEIMGCGMVDPNVISNCGINPDEFTGFAFGIGVERLAMLLYQIEDIRMFYENDVRFLNQFKFSD
ncbi:MAG: phenylalanine--tRNA ligase subunit alpha [Flavobacteriales bacterium]|nr:phenylalanine--tRNA ligase subunit alpha [Flavobacteriales bacterium]|tara:strand:- start:348 stop:1367 length:1020 start_codon:yes stop_codon:yes gene_type:complete